MRVVAVTRLWPNHLEPQNAAFNRQQFTALARLCDLEVLAPHPYLPGATLTGFPARHARLARMPRRDLVAGIPTTFMKQYYVPKLDAFGVPLFLASLLPHRRLLASGDVILASWAYPDACAVLLLARAMKKPCCVKVHGSDINVEVESPVARIVMRRVLPTARAVFSVSNALVSALLGLGVPKARIYHLPNGVDPALFRGRERLDTRRSLGVPEDERSLLFVGNLKEDKGLAELMAAFDSLASQMPALVMTVIGGGAWDGRVRRWATEHGDRVRILGELPHASVADWLAAADLLVLPSWREGTPNAVLEAMASGRPVVATRVGGIPDVVPPSSGILVPPRDADALAEAIAEALRRDWSADVIRSSSPGGWDSSAERIHDALMRLSAPPGGGAVVDGRA